MAKLVVDGAKLKCDQGTSQGSLTVLSTNKTERDGKALASVDDYTAMVNIGSFGMCQTQSNPQVAAATSAAQGVLTPQPCIPVVTSAWSDGESAVQINGHDALTEDSTCQCSYSGKIEVSDPNNDDVKVG